MSTDGAIHRWNLKPTAWLALVAIAPVLVFTFYPSLVRLIRTWLESEEYSHGLLIPFISLFLIWQKTPILRQLPLHGSFGGVVLTFVGIALYLVGELSAINPLVQLSFVLTLTGVAFAIVGTRGMREIWPAFLFLLFMVPLPAVIFQELSQHLQLISSALGVAVIRLFGISVFLEGNVIDLGSMQLQVVEACSGLRYLFPLMSLAFICAYFYREAFWKRALVFLSSVPITILLNSFRIGVIGILVEYWGRSQAEGFLHDFEGWVVFMAAVGLLIAEMWLLTRFSAIKRPFHAVFALEFPSATREPTTQPRQLPAFYFLSAGIVLFGAVGSVLVESRTEEVPGRETFHAFPLKIGTWQGTSGQLESMYQDVLKLDDYLLADYRSNSSYPINLYVAYYQSQRKAHSVHSPRACMPGGGWEIKDLTQIALPHKSTAPLNINRTLIQKGDSRQLVYYWFKQRDRNLSNEYLVKWYTFWDALTRNRTDGALVRLTTPLGPDEDLREADKRLAEFAEQFTPHLARYVPD